MGVVGVGVGSEGVADGRREEVRAVGQVGPLGGARGGWEDGGRGRGDGLVLARQVAAGGGPRGGLAGPEFGASGWGGGDVRGRCSPRS